MEQFLRVLIAEPNSAIATPLRALLAHNGLEADVFASIEEARQCDVSRYAAMVVDVKPEDAQGVQFIAWLHATGPHLAGRVVVVTADPEPVASALREAGICDIVPKPVNAEDILRAVLECLEYSPSHSVQ